MHLIGCVKRTLHYFRKNKLIINVKTMLTINMDTIGMNTKTFFILDADIAGQSAKPVM